MLLAFNSKPLHHGKKGPLYFALRTSQLLTVKYHLSKRASTLQGPPGAEPPGEAPGNRHCGARRRGTGEEEQVCTYIILGKHWGSHEVHALQVSLRRD